MFGRSVRTTQPQGPARIDWSNPITRELGCLVAGGQHLPSASGVGGITVTPKGISPRLTGGDAYLFSPYKKTSTELTIFSLTQLRGASGSLYYMYAGGDSTWVESRHSSVNTFRHEVLDSSGAWQSVGLVTGLVAQEHVSSCFVVSSPRNFTRVYKAGKAVSTGSTGGLTGLQYSKPDVGFFGSGFSGECQLLAVFSRALSDAEVKSLSDNPWQIFAPDSNALWVPAAASVSLPTLVQPNATTSAGAWAPTGAATLHAAINELVASDTQYISVNSASTAELELAEAAFPGTANQTLAYWASSTQGSTLTVTLKQGATEIMTRTHALTVTNTLYTQTLTAPEIALIVVGPISVTLTTS